jgi:tyrosinase
MLAPYSRAVARMRTRPADDPRSWSYQAAIHGTSASSPPALANECKHWSWFFVSWHRMFLYYFEAIVRAAVVEDGGPADWALPYWNYGLGGEHATLPPAFRQASVGGSENPLYVQQRRPQVNAGGALDEAIISPNGALARSQFTGAVEFGGGEGPPQEQFWSEPGALERTPHNDVHGAVGGRGGWMNDPLQAAQDPIFWLHHSNIDRVWALWNNEGKTNPTDATWLGQRFEFFDASGAAVGRTCAEVLDTVANLGYTYDRLERDPAAAGAGAARPRVVAASVRGAGSDMPSQAPQQAEIVGASEQPVRLVGAAEHVPVAIDRRASDAARARAASDAPPHVLLHLDDIEAEQNPGSVYAVYVNLPPGADDEQRAAHHAGNLSFFGIEHANRPPRDEHPHGLRLSMDITELAQRLREQGEWSDDQLQVSLLPVGVRPAPGATAAEAVSTEERHDDLPVTVGRVSVSYA